MTLIKRLFRKPPQPQPIGRQLRHLTLAERLDLSLKLGYCDGRVWAWGY